MISEYEVGVLTMAPLDPPGETWEMLTDSVAHGLAVDAIKSIREVEFDEPLGGVTPGSLSPGASGMDGRVKPQRASNPYLHWGEECLGILANR